MRVLAVDTATPTVCAAFVDTESGLVIERTELDPRRHVEFLTPFVRDVLSRAGVRPADLDLIVTGVGPGPYTGLRVGIVTARTMGLALGRPVVGVCSLDALARDAVLAEPRPVIAVSDARRREVYWAEYDATGTRVAGPLVTKPEVVREPGLDVVGPAASHVLPDADDSSLRPAALAEIAVLALERGEQIPTSTLSGEWSEQEGDGAGSVPLTTLLPALPLYLRHPDAQVPLALRGAQ